MGGFQGTAKQMFTMTTLIKNDYVEGKVGAKSQVSELLDVQECLSGDLKEMRMVVATRDAEIMQQIIFERPGASTGLRAENVELKG